MKGSLTQCKVRNKCAPYVLLSCFAHPAHAWEFTPGTPCLLTHETEHAAVELTFDPTVPLYTISITRDAPFTPAPVFSMTFSGPAGLSISTGAHEFSNGGRTLTVTDSGFGNVLNGLQFNTTATATLGTQHITLPLDGAAEPVAAFRACDVLPSS